MRKSTPLRTVVAITAVSGSLFCTGSYALDYSWAGIDFSLDNRVSIGVGWRMEERDNALLGKLNVPGQQDLCAPDDCLALDGDPAPVRRLVNAEGGFALHNTDNGNMNYDKGDPFVGVAKISSELTATWENLIFKLSGTGFFDEVNTDFDETHNNTRLQPRKSPRNSNVEDRYAKNAEIREAFVNGLFDIWGRDISISVGKQRVRWGEANLHLFNTLDQLNPLDAGLARMPGFEVGEINIPVGMAVIATDLTESLSVEAFYQYEWEPVRPDPAGSLLATNDVVAGGEYAILGLGQFAEDPDRLYVSEGNARFISQATRTVFPLHELFGAPDDGGQYGFKVSWFAEDVLDGTEFGFYFANYHSRLPYGSAFESDASCTRDAAVPGDLLSALVACQGFNSPMNPAGREPTPVDTVKIFFDYPEDIEMYGASFNTTIGKWSVAGEYAYFDNLPLQVLQSDLIMTAAQQAVPAEDIPVGVGVIPGATAFTIPGARSVFPALLTEFRNIDPQPGDYIPGFERMKVDQLVLNGIRIFSSSNPIKADQIIWLVEGGLTYVRDLPDIDTLAFQGAGDFTHPTPGSDGTGQPAGGPINTLSISPTQQREGFAEDFSWGLRTLVRLSYNNVFSLFNRDINLFPTLIWFEDIEGISPSPMQNYVEDTRMMAPALFFEMGNDFSGSIVYQYHDGDERNLRRDRDNLGVSLVYNF